MSAALFGAAFAVLGYERSCLSHHALREYAGKRLGVRRSRQFRSRREPFSEA
jgi:hypothetical protein